MKIKKHALLVVREFPILGGRGEAALHEEDRLFFRPIEEKIRDNNARFPHPFYPMRLTHRFQNAAMITGASENALIVLRNALHLHRWWTAGGSEKWRNKVARRITAGKIRNERDFDFS